MSLILFILALPLLIGAVLKGNLGQSLWLRLGGLMLVVGVVLRLFGL